MSSGRCGSNGSMAYFNRFIAGLSSGRKRRSPWSIGSDMQSQTQGQGGQKGSGQGLEHEDEHP